MTSVAAAPGASILYGQVTRANGKVERRRMLAYHHPNPLRRGVVRFLMLIGVF